MFADAYRGKSVFLTGHTGFKGSWLALWLERLGARVSGYALPPPTAPSLFEQAGVASTLAHTIGDIREREPLEAALRAAAPDFVFHLAAQPLVLDSYAAPAETFAINVAGSIEVMEAVRRSGIRASVVMITTDKVYQNNEWPHAYRECDALGGHDPYSASKAAMEIAIASWRSSFFARSREAEHGVRLAAARAGNVIGGGDWAANRIVPDLFRAHAAGDPPGLRNPGALRPWQHVLEPLAGYLWLGARMAAADGASLADAWNFGPLPTDVRSVGELSDALLGVWGGKPWRDGASAGQPHEAGMLRLAIDKAVGTLGWRPVWDFARTVERTAGWYDAVMLRGGDARAACMADLDAYCADAAALGLAWAQEG